MSKIFFICSIVFLTITISSSQEFEHHVSPFNIQVLNLNYSCCPTLKCFFADLNGDQAKDMIIGGIKELDTSFHHYSTIAQIRYFMEFQQNEGTLTKPMFNDRQIIFESYEWDTGESFWIPDIKDINDDGLLDFVVSSYVDSLSYQYLVLYIQNPDHTFERILSTHWDLDPFPPYSLMIPEVTDLDMDGDYDILLSGYFCYGYDPEVQYNKVIYAKNVGTKTMPEFEGWYYDPFGLKPGTYPKQFSTGDIDMDGDQDVLALVIGDDMTYLEFYENLGGPGEKPFFEEPVISPFNIPIPASSDDIYFFLTLEDIDNDGDIDIFIPRYNEDSEDYFLDYFENVMCTPMMGTLNVTICEGEVFELGNEKFNEAGTYFVKTKSEPGCIFITELHLKVEHDTSIMIVENLCRGDTYLIDNQEISTSGEYQLNLTGMNGCDSIINYFISFFEITTSVEQSNHSLIAVNDPEYQYQWFDCDTQADIQDATEHHFSPPYSGNFAVKIKHSNGCEALSECNYVIAVSNDEINESYITIGPNPTSDYVTIVNNSNNTIEKINIYSPSGKMVKEFIRPDNELIIHLEDEGTYIFVIDIGKRIIIKKIIFLKK